MIGTGEVSTPAPLTVMTTISQLRVTLRKKRTASTIESTTKTRDPTFAREQQLNNQAKVGSLVFVDEVFVDAVGAFLRSVIRSCGRIVVITVKGAQVDTCSVPSIASHSHDY